ncbi:MAG: response regulator transcription factor [Chloroflexi bacterium]|nr:response regulator transcription factor [Chloroflexota bacterium]
MAGLIRLAVVDDHPAISEGLAHRLAAEPDIELVGVASTLPAARQLINAENPDVVLSDVELGDGDRGFELLNPDGPADRVGPAILFLSAYDYPAFRALAMELGAAGYVLKTAPVLEILDAIRTAAAGRTTFTSQDLRAAQLVLRRPSDRELEVIELLAAGRTNDQIAASLAIVPRTVESHLRRLFARYSVYNRTALVMLALNHGWVEGPTR